MTYEVVFLNTFLRQFKKLSIDLQERIKQRIHELVEKPYLGLRLKGQLEEFWKDRVGDYRIIYKIEENTKRIVFYDVDIRKKVYG